MNTYSLLVTLQRNTNFAFDNNNFKYFYSTSYTPSSTYQDCSSAALASFNFTFIFLCNYHFCLPSFYFLFFLFNQLCIFFVPGIMLNLFFLLFSIKIAPLRPPHLLILLFLFCTYDAFISLLPIALPVILHFFYLYDRDVLFTLVLAPR